MKATKKVTFYFMLAAFLISSAAVFALAQKQGKKTRSSKTSSAKTTQSAAETSPTLVATPEPAPVKKNSRDSNTANGDNEPQSAPTEKKSEETTVRYFYEFNQPDFTTSRIVIEHGADGKGSITFERKNAEEPVTDPVEISPEAWTRIKSLWESLNFLDSNVNYQSDKKFPHLGTMRLKMKQGERERTVEFNWTNDKKASELVTEYRRVADQAIFVFDINLAREISPLEAPKLLDSLDSMLRRNSLSDPKQLLPLLKDISVDERLPLIARNHASRVIKQIEK
jgi:hypothetical protein